jgi:hypothetical protein
VSAIWIVEIAPGEDDGGLLHDTYLSRETAENGANAFGRPSAIHRAEVRDGSARRGDQLGLSSMSARAASRSRASIAPATPRERLVTLRRMSG